MPSVVIADPVVEALPYAVTLAEWHARVRDLPQVMLLGSGTSPHPAARYDILTADPRVILRTRNAITEITDVERGIKEQSRENPFDVLARYCSLDPSSAVADLPFTGGAIAWFGYELLHAANHITPHQSDTLTLPDMLAGIFDFAIFIDHKLQ